MRTSWIAAVVLLSATAAHAECVDVKYREGNPVCLNTFKCEEVSPAKILEISLRSAWRACASAC